MNLTQRLFNKTFLAPRRPKSATADMTYSSHSVGDATGWHLRQA